MASKARFNALLLRCIGVGALGGLLFGFDTAVVSGTTHALTMEFSLPPGALGLTVSSALWGTVVGAIAAGILGERLGGRASLRILAVCYFVSAVGCACAPSWWALVLFRFIGGLGIGGSSVLAPVYLAEVSPAEWRGRVVGAFQINIVVGILIAYLSNLTVITAHPDLDAWRYQFGIGALPALAFLLLLLGIPHSARWLVTKNRIAEARKVLAELGSSDCAADLASIVESIRPNTRSEHEHERLFQKRYSRPIFLAASIAFFNQMIGVNAILYYLNDIFAAAGFSQISGTRQAVAIGTTNMLATVIALGLIDRIGRKRLLLIGSVGIAVCLTGVSAIFMTHSHQSWLLGLLVVYMGFFALSQGAVIWVYIGEVFPNRIRAKGQSLGSATHWVVNALISFAFPLIAARSDSYPFIFFTAMVVVQFFVVLIYYPETKGVTLEHLQQRLGID